MFSHARLSRVISLSQQEPLPTSSSHTARHTRALQQHVSSRAEQRCSPGAPRTTPPPPPPPPPGRRRPRPTSVCGHCCDSSSPLFSLPIIRPHCPTLPGEPSSRLLCRRRGSCTHLRQFQGNLAGPRAAPPGPWRPVTQSPPATHAAINTACDAATIVPSRLTLRNNGSHTH